MTSDEVAPRRSPVSSETLPGGNIVWDYGYGRAIAFDARGRRRHCRSGPNDGAGARARRAPAVLAGGTAERDAAERRQVGRIRIHLDQIAPRSVSRSKPAAG
jgi:hypothetical protein